MAVLLTPLPRRVRLRLAAHRRIDHTCGWLIEHRLHAPAILVWRASGMWPGSRKATR